MELSDTNTSYLVHALLIRSYFKWAILLAIFICHHPSSFSSLIISSPCSLTSCLLSQFTLLEAEDQRTGRVRGFGISSQFPPSLNTADVAASLYNCNFSSHWALVIAFPPLALQSNGWEWLLTVISLSILQDPFFTPLTP